jgi:hypothetical protein
VAAECLLAFRATGDVDDDEAVVGAILIAELLETVRALRKG